MLKIRIQYTKKQELDKFVELLEKNCEILNIVEESKGNNPKYANSKNKLSYIDVDFKSE